MVRHKWTQYELDEIESLFAKCLADGKTPRKADVLDAHKKSKENGGTLFLMFWETTKKKVSNLIARRKKQVSVITLLHFGPFKASIH